MRIVAASILIVVMLTGCASNPNGPSSGLSSKALYDACYGVMLSGVWSGPDAPQPEPFDSSFVVGSDRAEQATVSLHATRADGSPVIAQCQTTGDPALPTIVFTRYLD